MKRLAKKLLQAASWAVYRHRSVEIWPPWVGNIHQTSVPSNVSPKHEPSPTGGANINIILQLLGQTLQVDGEVAECGVYRGATLITVGLHLAQTGTAKKLYGLDSFEGFDEAVDHDIQLGGAADAQKRRGGFGETSYEELLNRLKTFGLDRNVFLIKGYFEHTLKSLSTRRFSFVHLDCDIYESYKQCLEFFYPRLNVGAIVLFDEYNDPPWPGCNQAVDEFLQERPETVQVICRDNYQKYYIVKQ